MTRIRHSLAPPRLSFSGMVNLDDARPCPRCGCIHTIRWGRCRGTQRYRCRECRRTFSPRTATPRARSKLTDECWASYARLMQTGATLREIAASLGIHVTTAFRLRHAFLMHMTSPGLPTPLDGPAALCVMRFAYNEKGPRGLSVQTRSRNGHSAGSVAGDLERTHVLVACSASNGIRMTNLHQPFVYRRDVVRFLDRYTAPGQPVTPMGGCWTRILAHAVRVAGRELTSETADTLKAPELLLYRRRFKRWLAGFRGVRTRYLDRYLEWHLAIELGDVDKAFDRVIYIATTIE